jgi:hypothetical protein
VRKGGTWAHSSWWRLDREADSDAPAEMTGSRLAFTLGCLNKFVVETTKGRMESIIGGRSLLHDVVPLSWC